MLTCFWDAKGLIQVDYLEKGHNITGAYYADLVHKSRRSRRKPKELSLWLLQDNAPVHKSAVATKAIEDSGFSTILHPPYNPDLSPSDYKLFNALKSALSGKKFEETDDLKDFVNDWFGELSPSFFIAAFEDLPVRWQKCIAVKGLRSDMF
jgi:transposase